MVILDNDFQIKDMDELTIFLESKRIIYSLCDNILFRDSSKKHRMEDIEQECALKFFKFVIKSYNPEKRTTIGKYLKTVYRHVIENYLWREHRNTFLSVETGIADDVEAVDIHNWHIENMEISELLTYEQNQIIGMILDGYDYAEICLTLFPKRQLVDPKRPVYRRMIKIKATIKHYLSSIRGVQ